MCKKLNVSGVNLDESVRERIFWRQKLNCALGQLRVRVCEPCGQSLFSPYGFHLAADITTA